MKPRGKEKVPRKSTANLILKKQQKKKTIKDLKSIKLEGSGEEVGGGVGRKSMKPNTGFLDRSKKLANF